MRVHAARHATRLVRPSAILLALIAGASLTSAQSPAAPAAQGAAEQAPAPGAIKGTPANDPERGAAVLAEARAALGGAERLQDVQRIEARGKSARAIGNNVLEGDFEFKIELPDKFRRKESIGMNQGGIEITQILNGAEIVEESQFVGGGDFDDFDGGGRGGRGRGGRGGTPNLSGLLGGVAADPNATPEAQKEAQRTAAASEMARLIMGWLLTASEPVAWIGTAESPDGTADVLEFTTPDGVPTRLLIDSKTRMPLMLSWTGTAPQLQFGGRGRGGRGGRGGSQTPAGPTTLTMYLSDYKNVSGIRLPHLIQRGPNGETIEELVVRNYRINPSFEPDTFTK